MNDVDSGETVFVAIEDEMRVATGVLVALGVRESDARIQARWLVEADQRGYGSHGLQRLPLLAERIKRGLAASVAEVVYDWRSESLLAVDGGRGLGPVVALDALEVAYRSSARTGVTVVALSNTNHLGMLAPYVEWLTQRSRIGIAFTTSEALVHPWGGRRAMIGTNPLAIGVPARPQPLVVDLATGTVSMGKIIRYRELNATLEAGWALDAEGRPTLDPDAALKGAISPFGGAKGFALGVALEVLVGALTQSALGRDVGGTLDAESVCNKGDVFISIDPQVMGDFAERLEAVSSYLAQLRAEPTQEGVESIRLPGDRSAQARATSAQTGVELPRRVWQAALALADALQVDLTSETQPRSGAPDTGSGPHSTERNVES